VKINASIPHQPIPRSGPPSSDAQPGISTFPAAFTENPVNRAQKQVSRVFAISDIHVDYKENMSWIRALSSTDYLNDAIIVGGDVSSDLDRLQRTIECLKERFSEVFFVPGNHELWIGRCESRNSMTKFSRILSLCASMGVHTNPTRVGKATGDGVWIIPLFSWYQKPEEGNQSLFMKKRGEDPEFNKWADDHLIRWTQQKEGVSIAESFLAMNESNLQRHYDAPVISFSHFLPRRELMYCPPSNSNAGVERKIVSDPNPSFNFSRVAGCSGLEEQIRRLGSVIHIYGHQHRNRDRQFEGIRYISHCLGYPQERESGEVSGMEQGPLQIWPG
jgi:Icc-related predicted phosphoesterase